MPNPHDSHPRPQLDSDELARHLELLDTATTEELDELLTDLLCHTHHSRAAQSN